ncbi:tyrosine-type recombinase/integrase [Specibacter cremeus]|uniref:tyrosine-type recombinase/integrase n=1 Tax=Specibacter cremeus TaxID=1629051 RepID=UPI000F77CF40|nr:tyrosine-type recombinase/integrase [Specibacter cremeus]
MTRTLESYEDDYLLLRHTMGHQLKAAGNLLHGYLKHLNETGQNTLTVDTALEWACLPAMADPRTKAARLSAVRGFAAYVHAREPLLAAPVPAGLIPTRMIRQQPYIYGDSQVQALMRQALSLQPATRGLTMQTLIGLMASTGMRIGECVGLNLSDIDWASGVLTVRGKRGNTRLVPIGHSTAAALQHYLHASRAGVPACDPVPFFISSAGHRSHPSSLESAFRTLRAALGYTARPGGKAARLHDLRHTFATNALLQAYRDGVDVDARTVTLATYLGHVSPASTYWYLTAIPELLAIVEERVSAAQHQGELLS